MYSFIIHPINRKKYPIESKVSKNLLKKYILNLIAGSDTETYTDSSDDEDELMYDNIPCETLLENEYKRSREFLEIEVGMHSRRKYNVPHPTCEQKLESLKEINSNYERNITEQMRQHQTVG